MGRKIKNPNFKVIRRNKLRGKVEEKLTRMNRLERKSDGELANERKMTGIPSCLQTLFRAKLNRGGA